MVDLAPGWKLHVDRGPDWVFVRVQPPDGMRSDSVPLADSIWSVLQQHFTYRLVLELDQVTFLHSHLIGQLVWLNKRIHQNGGLMRVCGLSDQNQQVIQACRLGDAFPNYGNRGDAVMGHRPHQPR